MSEANHTIERPYRADTEAKNFQDIFQVCYHETRDAMFPGKYVLNEAETRDLVEVALTATAQIMDELTVSWELSDHAVHWCLVADVRGIEVEVPLGPIDPSDYGFSGVYQFLHAVVNLAVREHGGDLHPANLAEILLSADTILLRSCKGCVWEHLHVEIESGQAFFVSRCRVVTEKDVSPITVRVSWPLA